MRISNEQKIISRDILILAFPAILEMALNTLVGLADTLMISRLIGKEGLAAVGFANQIIFTLIYIFSSFNAGATAMISRSYGERNYKKLNKIVGQNLSLNFLIGIIIFLVSYFFSQNLLSVFDISKTVLEMGTTYLKYISLSQLFMFISFAGAASLRGAGDTKTPMYITGIANVLNIIGNYLLMTGYGFFPELGIAGAAISTTFARGIAALLYLYTLILRNNSVKLIFNNLKPSQKIIKPLWNLSYAAGLEQLFMQLAFFISGIIISKLDTTSEAAFRILVNIESTSFMPATGISIATATLVGKYLGEKDPLKSLKAGKTAAALGITWGLFIGIIFIVFPIPLLKIFTNELALINKATFTLKVAGINQALLAVVIVLGGALRGTGDMKGIMFITLFRLWFINLPLAYIFIIYYNFGVAGAWYAETISFLVSSIFLYRRFTAMGWAKIKLF